MAAKTAFKRKENEKKSHLCEISQSSLLEDNSCVGRFKGLSTRWGSQAANDQRRDLQQGWMSCRNSCCFFLVGWYMPLNKGMFRFGSSNPLELIQTLAVPISGEDVAVQSGYPPLPCCSGSRAQMGAWKLGRSIKWSLFLGALFSDEPTWQMAFGFRDFRSWKEWI